MNATRQQSVVKRVSSGLIAGAALAAYALAGHHLVSAQSARTSDHWVGTWATAVVARPQTPPGGGQAQGQPAAPRGQGAAGTPAPAAQAQPAPAGQPSPAPAAGAGQAPQGQAQAPAAGRGGAPPLNFNNQTLRQIVHTSLGGTRARVVLSNQFGTAPLAVGAARIALRDKDASIVAKSDRALTFSGSPTTTIPAGAVVLSDPVSITIPQLSDVAVDIYLPGDTAASPSPLTTHGGARQTNYVSESGNHAGEENLPVATTTLAWFFLARVEVSAPEQTGVVALLGDSITDGTASTDNTNNRWSDHLARRLLAPPSGVKMGVLNLGIGGNRVLTDGGGQSALARFDRDVLVQPGVTHVVVMEGINDIPRGATAEEVIAGLQQLVDRAHARGLRIYGGTITPCEGVSGNFATYFTPETEAKRNAINEWIRTGKAYDAVIDFDARMRDPNRPTQLRPEWASMDKLHPNDAGYQAMAAAVDLALFKAAQTNPRSAGR
jgi:lysophospholipase L1-like esterase